MFCQICANLLTVDIINEALVFVCNGCQSKYDASDDDSLRYEDVKGSDITIFKKILEKISADPANPKIYRACKQEPCTGNIAKYVRLGDDLKLVYSCTTCQHMSM